MTSLLPWLPVVALFGCDTPPEDNVAHGGPDAVPEQVVSDIDTLVTTESGLLGEVSGIGVSADGSVWLADEMNHRILVLDAHGEIDLLGREGSRPGEFRAPRGLGVSDASLEVYDYHNGRIQRLSAGGEYLESYPAPDILLPPVAMNGAGVVVGGTMGRHNSLVVLVGPEVEGDPYRGEARAPTPPEISLARLRQQAQERQVPQEISNSVVPVLGPAGELWIVVQADAMLEHFDAQGNPQWATTLAAPEVGAAYDRFFSAWDGPVGFGSMPFPWVVRWGVLFEGELWLMMDAVGDTGSVVLRVDAASGEPKGRLVLPVAGRAGPFAVDGDRGLLYLSQPEEGQLLRGVLP